MARSFVGAIGTQGRAQQRICRLTAAATMLAAGLTACGDDRGNEGPGAAASDDATHLGETLVIKTRVTGFKGKVLQGSMIGDSRFCPDGAVRHDFGSPEIGFPAVNVFLCADGHLSIGFGAGPSQMNRALQTSDWKILDGTGRYAGMSGKGGMQVQWERVGGPTGEETFKGRVVAP